MYIRRISASVSADSASQSRRFRPSRVLPSGPAAKAALRPRNRRPAHIAASIIRHCAAPSGPWRLADEERNGAAPPWPVATSRQGIAGAGWWPSWWPALARARLQAGANPRRGSLGRGTRILRPARTTHMTKHTHTHAHAHTHQFTIPAAISAQRSCCCAARRTRGSIRSGRTRTAACAQWSSSAASSPWFGTCRPGPSALPAPPPAAGDERDRRAGPLQGDHIDTARRVVERDHASSFRGRSCSCAATISAGLRSRPRSGQIWSRQLKKWSNLIRSRVPF